jgi:hypothetical protein
MRRLTATKNSAALLVGADGDGEGHDILGVTAEMLGICGLPLLTLLA